MKIIKIVAIVFVSLCVLNISYESVNASVYSEYIEGDIDGNGMIDASDALIILKAAARLQLPSVGELSLTDFNCDMTLDAEDALLVLKKAAKLIDEFPYDEGKVKYADKKYQELQLEWCSKILGDFDKIIPDTTINEFGVYDIDLDGIPELLLVGEKRAYVLNYNNENIELNTYLFATRRNIIYLGIEEVNECFGTAVIHPLIGSPVEDMLKIYAE